MNLCAPGVVPGNSSISLSPQQLQETETQTPPLRLHPAEPGAGLGAGSWGLGAGGCGLGAAGKGLPEGRVRRGGRSGPSPTGRAEAEVGSPQSDPARAPTYPRGHRPQRLNTTLASHGKAAPESNPIALAAAEGGVTSGGDAKRPPPQQHRGGRHFCAPTVCRPNQGGGAGGLRRKGRSISEDLTPCPHKTR